MRAGAEEYRIRLADGLKVAGSIKHLQSKHITDCIAWSLPFTLGIFCDRLIDWFFR
jgi:hypothetical protein